MSSTGEQLNDYNASKRTKYLVFNHIFVYLDNFIEANTSITNESLSITDTSSSLILEALSTSQTPSNSTIENDFTSYLTSQKLASINSLIDQINAYRNIQIISRIKQCDSNMRLNDMCELYSIDNNTNSLILQSNIEFYTFENIFDGLVNRIIIQKLNKFCLSTNWCLGNLSEIDIQYTNEVIQTRGYSFCSLEQCNSRLLLFIDSCSTLSNTVKDKSNIFFILFYFF